MRYFGISRYACRRHSHVQVESRYTLILSTEQHNIAREMSEIGQKWRPEEEMNPQPQLDYRTTAISRASFHVMKYAPTKKDSAIIGEVNESRIEPTFREADNRRRPLSPQGGVKHGPLLTHSTDAWRRVVLASERRNSTFSQNVVDRRLDFHPSFRQDIGCSIVPIAGKIQIDSPSSEILLLPGNVVCSAGGIDHLECTVTTSAKTPEYSVESQSWR